MSELDELRALLREVLVTADIAQDLTFAPVCKRIEAKLAAKVEPNGWVTHDFGTGRWRRWTEEKGIYDYVHNAPGGDFDMPVLVIPLEADDE